MPSSASTAGISSYTACTRVVRPSNGRQPRAGQLEGVLVAVDADDVRLGAAVEHGLGVAAETEGGVDEHRARALERRGHQRHDPVEEDRDVGGTRSSAGRPSSRAGRRGRGARRRRRRTGAEKAITARESRTSWRTRRAGVT